MDNQPNPQIDISDRTLADIEMIAHQGFSPLKGFLGERDYMSVVEHMRLVDGQIWPIPITLSVDASTASRLKIDAPARLVHAGETIGLIKVESVYQPDKTHEAKQVYKTDDQAHPGVAALFAQKEFYVGGRLDIHKLPEHQEFSPYNLTPLDTRKEFWRRGWKTIVGFQTRNPMHRGHEMITKVAMEKMDGLLIHPLVGETKEDDVPAKVRIKSYEVLIKNYYPTDRTMLAINPSNMYFAGPREAVLHALVRRNYGCTHFIIGRDHAGVGSYYSPTAAQDLVQTFSSKELGIVPMFFESALNVSGSKIREMLKSGQRPSDDLMRPEVADVLLEGMAA